MSPSTALLLVLSLGACAPEPPVDSSRHEASENSPSPEAPSHAPAPRPQTPASAPVEADVPARGQTWAVPLDRPLIVLPAHAPALLLHLTPGSQDAQVLPRVVFLHGYSACVRALSARGQVPCGEGLPTREGWGLADAADDSGRALALLLPQLAFLRRDGDPGRLVEQGEAQRYLEGAMRRGYAVSGRGTPPPGPWILIAHSGGFTAAAAIAAHGELELRAIVLLDALYGAGPLFARWLARNPRARLVSVHRPGGEPARLTRLLARRLRRELGPAAVAKSSLDQLAVALRDHRFVELQVRTPHAQIPSRHLATLLRALLPP